MTTLFYLNNKVEFTEVEILKADITIRRIKVAISQIDVEGK
ncbi:MAG TPA: hypothetical protein PKA80_10905 [Ignavibacteriaceae bacterium]|nr:hypothetical protein [Ignavibacteriaceae bacterium]